MARGLDSLAEGGTNYLVTTLSYSNSQRLILIPIPILATMVTVHGSCALPQKFGRLSCRRWPDAKLTGDCWADGGRVEVDGGAFTVEGCYEDR